MQNKETNLAKAFKKMEALKIKTNGYQYIQITNILKDLALDEWREGRQSMKQINNL